MKYRVLGLMTSVFFATCTVTAGSYAAESSPVEVKRSVDQAVQALRAKYAIPGLAVGVLVNGKSYVYNYGVASTASHRPVTGDTLFEIGSVSKTLTATLTSYAQASGQLSLSDPTSKYLPSLRGSQFGEVTLLNLGTHTAGGLPLQVPDNILNDAQLLEYFKAWRPTYAPGTYRTYSNVSIGTLGLITAKSMGQDFSVLMEQRLLPALGMKNTFIHIPEAHLADYAQGYTTANIPVRLSGGELSSEAYGIKTTAADMLRFVAANMNLIPLEGKLQAAITATHTGYFQAGPMTQDLIWEQYPYPVALPTLQQGNSPAMLFKATPVTALTPPQPPRQDVWINKTGSTNGFSTYLAFIPAKQVGIVILANKSVPIDERVIVAHEIMTVLTDGPR